MPIIGDDDNGATLGVAGAAITGGGVRGGVSVLWQALRRN